MFGLGNNDDEERFWNFIMFKFYATDEEMDQLWAIIAILGVLALIGMGGAMLWKLIA